MADFEHFSSFSEDMDIIQKLGDNPNTDDNMSSTELKTEFDKGGNLLKVFLNGMVEHLNELVNMLNNSGGGTVMTGGTMIGPLNMNGQRLFGLNAPTADNQAANKAYVDSAVDSAKKYSDAQFTLHTVTLEKYGWSNSLQTVAVTGVTADQTATDVIVSPDPADDNRAAYLENDVRVYAQMDGAVQFKCESTPDIDLVVSVMVRRADGNSGGGTVTYPDGDEVAYG